MPHGELGHERLLGRSNSFSAFVDEYRFGGYGLKISGYQ